MHGSSQQPALRLDGIPQPCSLGIIFGVDSCIEPSLELIEALEAIFCAATHVQRHERCTAGSLWAGYRCGSTGCRGLTMRRLQFELRGPNKDSGRLSARQRAEEEDEEKWNSCRGSHDVSLHSFRSGGLSFFLHPPRMPAARSANLWQKKLGPARSLKDCTAEVKRQPAAV